jgi:hypothetical protein
MREASQAAANIIAVVDQTQAEKTKSKIGPFDASRIDRKEFDALIGTLLRSRSHESDEPHAEDDLSAAFLVVGWFSKGSSDPYERSITLKSDVSLFKQLRKEVDSIRGWREYISLKSLCGFSLYEVYFFFPLFHPLTPSLIKLLIRYTV